MEIRDFLTRQIETKYKHMLEAKTTGLKKLFLEDVISDAQELLENYNEELQGEAKLE